MEQEGLAETAIVYNAAISACQRGLQPQVAMDVFRRMEKQGIVPTGVTFRYVTLPKECLWTLMCFLTIYL